MRIETERLTLRKLEEADFAGFFGYYSEPEVARWLWGCDDVDEAAVRAAFDYNMGLELCFALVLKSSGNIIGNIHFVNVTENYLVEVGYILCPNHWSRGYMTEGLKAAMDFAFNTYGLGLLRAVTEVDNTASKNLLTRCGFVEEAVLSQVPYGGRVADVCHFAAGKQMVHGGDAVQFNRTASLPQLQEYVRRVLKMRGLSEQPVQHSVLLLCEEVGELAKAIRRQTKGMSFGNNISIGDKDSVESELADILIVLTAIANAMDINLADAFAAKEKINWEREWKINI